MPVSGIRKASSASEGTVCSEAGGEQHGLRERAHPRRHDAHRHAHRDGRRERREHEHRVLQREAGEVGREDRRPEAAARPRRRRAEELARHGSEIDAVELRAGVQADHRRLVDPALESRPRRERARVARGRVEAVQHHGVVAREEAAVVGEHPDAERAIFASVV